MLNVSIDFNKSQFGRWVGDSLAKGKGEKGLTSIMQLSTPPTRQAYRWTILCLILLLMLVMAFWGVQRARDNMATKHSQAAKAVVTPVKPVPIQPVMRAKSRRVTLEENFTEIPMEVLEWAKNELSRNETSRDIAGEAGKLRLWAKLKDQPSEVAQKFASAIEHQLMGWVARGSSWPNVKRMRESWQPGRAIVITTGNRYAPMTLNVIRSVREVFNSTIPIHIYYTGETDLKPELRKALLSYGATGVEDLRPMFGAELSLAGWDAKPFAMLACPWTEVLLLDADTVLMQPPEAFFEDVGYRETGALFFSDRILGGNDAVKQSWVERLIPGPLSENARASLFYLKRTVYWLESGAVVIDKDRCFTGMLASCIINALPERDELHVHTHGEKEGFWLGFEMAAMNYSMMSTPAGSIGREMDTYVDHTKRPQQRVCGKLAHYDRKGQLMWFNDGVVKDKSALPADHVPATLRWTLMSWDWQGMCAKYDVESPKTPLTGGFEGPFGGAWKLSDEEVRLIDRMIDLFLVDPLDPQSSLRTHVKRSTLRTLLYRLVAAIHL